MPNYCCGAELGIFSQFVETIQSRRRKLLMEDDLANKNSNMF